MRNPVADKVKKLKSCTNVHMSYKVVQRTSTSKIIIQCTATVHGISEWKIRINTSHTVITYYYYSASYRYRWERERERERKKNITQYKP